MIRCVGASRTILRPESDCPTRTVFERGVDCVPTRTVFVPPVVTREENGAAERLSPEIEICDGIGVETEDKNSQTPAALGFGFT